jgi:RNA polymerase sigma-70 factor (ECF subfamily)
MPESRSVDWNEIVGRHAAAVCRVALRILRNVPDAEDVSQDVFAEALALKDAGGILNWEAFLVRVTTLRSLDRLRRRRKSSELRDEEHHYSADPADALMADELSD